MLQEVSVAWQSLNATLATLLGSNYNATTLVQDLATQNLLVYDKLGQLSNLYVTWLTSKGLDRGDVWARLRFWDLDQPMASGQPGELNPVTNEPLLFDVHV